MRVMKICKANANELYNKTSLAEQLTVSVRTLDRYVIDEVIESKAQLVGKRKVYLGSDINAKLDELVESEDKFVLSE